MCEFTIYNADDGLERRGPEQISTHNINVDGAMHFIYSYKYNTNSAEDSSDMN